jgi:uncharacterized protein
VPVATSYPGVYIQEEPSSVHTITGVPTSVAAFVGYSKQGPVNQAVQVNSWTDFVRVFGPLDPDVDMSYAVFLFFANGGSTAQIVRAGGTSGNTPELSAQIQIGKDFILEATSEGKWANNFAAQVTLNTPPSPPAADPANPPPAPAPTSFNLALWQYQDGTGWVAVETYNQLTPNRVALALASSSYFKFSAALSKTAEPSMPAAGVYGTPTASGISDKITVGTGSSATQVTPSKSGADGADTSNDITKLDIEGATPGSGVRALDFVDIFNILCLPKPSGTDYSPDILSTVAGYCQDKRAMLIVDPPSAWSNDPHLQYQTALTGYPRNANAAIYFPEIQTTNPTTGLTENRGPCGAMAGVWAATDAARGLWKAPAGTAASVVGIDGLAANMDDGESGVLNPLGINCLRTLPLAGPVVWGARTCRGADELADQWKYLPVRRTALFIEESLRRGTQWIVFEPNDETLWAAIRLNVGAFMNSLFRQGAFQGSTPQEAYLVKCDAENNPQNDIDNGIVNILVGFSPLKPAEFVIIHIQQLAGQLHV